MAIPTRKLLLLVGAVSITLVLVLYLNRDAPVQEGPRMTATDLETILSPSTAAAGPATAPGAPPPQQGPGLDGDVRLLAHLRQRERAHGPGSWRQFPDGVRDLYITLRMEEIARTDGFILGLAGSERGLGDVEPEEAAMAYDLLGQTEAGDLMRKLDALVARDGAAWRANIHPPAGTMRGAAPDKREIDRIGLDFAQRVPAIRAARLAWIRAHTDEVLGK